MNLGCVFIIHGKLSFCGSFLAAAFPQKTVDLRTSPAEDLEREVGKFQSMFCLLAIALTGTQTLQCHFKTLTYLSWSNDCHIVH